MYLVNSINIIINGILMKSKGIKNKNDIAQMVDKNIEKSKNAIAYTISLAV